jgi:hypothetical protein
MIFATILGPHTGEGIILLVLAAPLVAFLVLRNGRPLYRIGLSLTAHALAFAGAIELGVRRRDMMVYDFVEALRFNPPSLDDGLDLLFYGLFFVILIMPAIFAIWMILFPSLTRRYFHWIALMVSLAFTGIALFEAITDWHLRTFLEVLSISAVFGVAWGMMRFAPEARTAEPGGRGNE